VSFLLLDHLVWDSILLPTLPLEREIGPTEVDIFLLWIWVGDVMLWIGRVGLKRGLEIFLRDGPIIF
jgi:hypothetical protein